MMYSIRITSASDAHTYRFSARASLFGGRAVQKEYWGAVDVLGRGMDYVFPDFHRVASRDVRSIELLGDGEVVQRGVFEPMRLPEEL